MALPGDTSSGDRQRLLAFHRKCSAADAFPAKELEHLLRSPPIMCDICNSQARHCRYGTAATSLRVSLSAGCCFAQQTFVRWLLRLMFGPARTGARRFCMPSHTMFVRPGFLSCCQVSMGCGCSFARPVSTTMRLAQRGWTCHSNPQHHLQLQV